MPLSLHDVSLPTFRHMLGALSKVLDKAQAHEAGQGRDPAALLQARLAPDMLPLVSQVQIATDHAKGATARLAGREVPSFPDDEKDFAALKARIARTLSFVEGVPADAMEGAETREVVLQLRDREMRFDGRTYLLHFALPNFYFHVTTAYDILRAQGVPLGKRDFMGAS